MSLVLAMGLLFGTVSDTKTVSANTERVKSNFNFIDIDDLNNIEYT